MNRQHYKPIQDFNNILNGDWASDGLRILNLDISEVSCQSNFDSTILEDKDSSGLTFGLKWKGKSKGVIYFGSRKPEVWKKEGVTGIGILHFESNAQDSEMPATGYIFLEKQAFVDFSRSIRAFNFKCKIYLSITLKENPPEFGDRDFVEIMAYELYQTKEIITNN